MTERLAERPGAAERPQGSGAAVPGRGGRMARQRKTAAVLRLLRGEDLETVSRAFGVTAAALTTWRDAFLAAGEASLASRPGGGEALATIEELRRAMLDFREAYNATWLIDRNEFRPPAAVRDERLQPAALAA